MALGLFVAAWSLALFFAGMYVQQRQAWPARAWADAAKTLRVLAARQGLVSSPVDEPDLDEAPAASVPMERLS